jgi:hypothetical protein
VSFSPRLYGALTNIKNVSLWCQGKNCTNDPTFTTPPVAPGGKLFSYQPSAASGGAYGEIFKETALFYLSDLTSGINTQTLQALCDIFGQDFLAWRQLSFDEVFNHILGMAQSGLIDETIWNYNALEVITRIFTYPPHWSIQELGHFDYAKDCTGTALPCHYYYAPPNLCCSVTGTVGATTVTTVKMYMSRYKICLEDGRLVSRFVTYDPICDCPPPSGSPPIGGAFMFPVP